MEEDIKKSDELKLDFAYRIMNKKLETQMSAHNSLENKIASKTKGSGLHS